MEIYSYLKKDHRKVSGLMEEVLAAKSASKRRELFETIKDELSMHAETEEKTFYAALKAKGGKALKEKEGHAEEEHGEIRKFLHQIEKAKTDSPEWLVAFGELKHSVEHHVEEEEGEIFDMAKKVLSDTQAEELAEEMDALKKRKKGIPVGKKQPEDRSFLGRVL